jgi:hypothetical protein
MQNIELADNGMDGVDTFTPADPEPDTPEDREKFYQEVCVSGYLPHDMNCSALLSSW